MVKLPSRQVHLDFHTSELIPNVGGNFDKAAMASRLARRALELDHRICQVPSQLELLPHASG